MSIQFSLFGQHVTYRTLLIRQRPVDIPEVVAVRIRGTLILIGQVELLSSLDLAIHQDLKSRVTYSVVTKRLPDDTMRAFIHRELDRIGLAHSTFPIGATELIIRSADGVLRPCRNLGLSAMLEAVRAAVGRTINIDVVNCVLLQPRWPPPRAPTAQGLWGEARVVA